MKAITTVFLLLISSCSQQKVSDLKALNGYWEIEKVVLPDGQTKSYNVNPVVDHYNLHSDSTGIRQKVMPQLDGRFISNNLQESFTVELKDKEILIHYQTEESSHTETLLKLNEKTLVVKNQENITYFYKPFEKFEVQ